MVIQEWGVPGYAEVRTLGSGGFGQVVLARQSTSGALVAIKYLHRTLLDDPDFVAMFRAEAQVLASLDDPNVVRLYEYVESPSGAAIVMELIEGASLRDMLAQHGKTSAESALVVLQGSLLGLAAAHARGVVHRDYKPENVLVDGAGRSKLTDFGIATRAGDRPMPAGTLKYAPPEQFGGGLASPAGDVYAATATFYECLTGRPPFTGTTQQALLRQHMSEPVALEPVPAPLRPLVAAGLAKDPAARPADAASFVTRLRAVAEPAYGPDWERRGRSHLAEGVLLLLAALWPSGQPAAQGLTTQGPAAQGHSVEQAQLSRNAQASRQPPRAAHPEPGRGEQAGQTGHQEHVSHLQHLEHEHAEHLEHLEHLAHERAQHPDQSGRAPGTRSQRLVRAAGQSRRVPRWARRALPRDPGAGAATAIVAGTAGAAALIVAAVATIAVAATSSGSAPHPSPASAAVAASSSAPPASGPSSAPASSGPAPQTSPASPAAVLAGPGTNCGNNGLTWGGGKEQVVVVTGQIDCTTAIQTFNQYATALRSTTQEQVGSAGILSFDGWNCGHNSIAGIQSTGIDAQCGKGGVNIETKAT
jgi:Protein kinase domain